MAQMKRMNIVYLQQGQESPLANHHPFEIGVDESGTEPVFYVFPVFANTYGTNGVEGACQRFIGRK